MLKKIMTGGIAILIPLISACASTPPTNFYVLEALSQTPVLLPDAVKKRQIGIGPITLPSLLARKQIVTRAEHNSVQIAEFHQWAEPLKDNVAQVLIQNLSQLQPHTIFRLYPWSAYGTVNYRVIIDIIRLDTWLGKSANIEATWAVMDEKTHTIISNGHAAIEHRLTDESYPATVNALSQLLNEFSQKLSLALP